MLVDAILARKGPEVFTIDPSATVGAAVEALRVHRVGALVVSTDGVAVGGIVSERDVVRHLAEHGASRPRSTGVVGDDRGGRDVLARRTRPNSSWRSSPPGGSVTYR